MIDSVWIANALLCQRPYSPEVKDFGARFVELYFYNPSSIIEFNDITFLDTQTGIVYTAKRSEGSGHFLHELCSILADGELPDV